MKPVITLPPPEGQFCHLGLIRSVANYLLFPGDLTTLKVNLVTGQCPQVTSL